MPTITASTAWMVFSTALALLVVLGYALFDIGSVRSKNSTGTVVRHLLVTCATTLLFLFMGFGLYFGGQGGFFGVLDFFTLGNYGPDLPEGVPLALFILSQTVVCVIAANIVCGAVAERSNIASQVAIALVIGLFVFPFVSRWTWGAGWLAAYGFHDFAGTASLNLTAGVVALVAAALTGPRAGKYDDAGVACALPGQSMTRCFIGMMLIFVGWFGLVGVALPVFGTESLESLGQALLNMLLVPSVSLLVAMAISQVRYGCIDIPVVLNAFVGGLVAVSSGADVLGYGFAALLGIVVGAVVVAGIELLERALKIDDPVGAVASHGLCSVAGLVFVGLFASDDGLIFGGAAFCGIELLGAVMICAWSALFSWIVLAITRRVFDLRVLDAEEETGLGLSGPSLNNAYAAYLPALSADAYRTGAAPVPDLPPSIAVPLELAGDVDSYPLKKVEVLCRPACLERLREELRAIGVTGMTVYQAEGCGEQRGSRETYRGVSVDVGLVPKIKIDIVVSRVPVADVVKAARRALYTGHIGDGKIFIYGVAEAVKVRTGEHGFDAVQSYQEQAEDRV